MKTIPMDHTELPVRLQSKTVARVIGWETLQPGTQLQPTLKGKKLGPPIRVVDVRREKLGRMAEMPRYGKKEAIREGFGGCRGGQGFVDHFCFWNEGATPETIVTRIEFEYTVKLKQAELSLT